MSAPNPPVPGSTLVQRARAFPRSVTPGTMLAVHPDLIGHQAIKRPERILRAFWLERPRAELWKIGPACLLIVDPERGAEGLVFTFTTQEEDLEQ